MAPRARWFLLGLILIAFALRLWRLGGESLWYDETVSVALAQLPAAELVERTAGDIHPPGYYLLLHGWQALVRPTPDAAGRSAAHPLEFLYGFTSVMAAMIIVALLVPLGRRLVGARATLIGVALAAVNPFHIWYAQEVRMYALAGALGLLCLWATLQWMERGRPRDLALYVVAAAGGLWALYYFAFLLAGVAVAALLLAPTAKRFWTWVGAQLGVLLLYAPWLPVLWRQATEPPVPPWRVPWNSVADFAASAGEALAAPLMGHVRLGPPAWTPWLWALGVVALTLLFLWRGEATARRRWALVAAIFVPTLLLLAVSIVGPPLHHARYLFPWSAGFPLVAGGALAGLIGDGRRAGDTPRRVAAWGVGGALVVASLFALQRFWNDPAYAADDHRAAVSALAESWRPGDAVLVNAGWAWTPLAVYWPQDGDAPPLAPMVRLKDVADGAILPEADALAIPVVRSGSVGGSPSLGWGNPASDFFATTAAESAAGLERLAQRYDRLWHYRIYDTVSDPAGDLRAWLDGHGTLGRDDAIPGRDFGRLQRYGFAAAPTVEAPANPSAWLVQEGGAPVLTLLDATLFGEVVAGAPLYATVVLEPDAALADLGTGISSSLRLVDAGGGQVAQADESPLPPTTEWPAGEAVTLRLAVRLPAPLPAGPLHVDLLLYRQDTAEPLPVVGPGAVEGTRLRLR